MGRAAAKSRVRNRRASAARASSKTPAAAKTGAAKTAACPRRPSANRRKPARTRESLKHRQARCRALIALLRKLYPDADCALEHGGAWELLVATILSAQSTDVTINKITPILFAAYPTPQALADAPIEHLEEIIHSSGFFRQKAKNIQASARRLVEEFGGEVPDTLEALTTLPGVARKTANVVLGTHFGKNEGVVVDTHVGRLAVRLGLTWNGRDGKDAVKIEQDLMQVVPREDWTYLGHALILHGRQVCDARKPRCESCTLSALCPSAGTFA
ncbi:MAG: endonuclease III [Phycisphaerales bacterium]|nr:endonuclease III [Phycisphaerales bacterium]